MKCYVKEPFFNFLHESVTMIKHTVRVLRRGLVNPADVPMIFIITGFEKSQRDSRGRKGGSSNDLKIWSLTRNQWELKCFVSYNSQYSAPVCSNSPSRNWMERITSDCSLWKLSVVPYLVWMRECLRGPLWLFNDAQAVCWLLFLLKLCFHFYRVSLPRGFSEVYDAERCKLFT